jgi:hypothetical protein
MPVVLDSPLPLSIHLARKQETPPKDLVLYNSQALQRITSFELLISPTGMTTHFNVAGCFPIPRSAPDDANSNAAYPLRIRLNQNPYETMVTLCSRPLGGLTALQVRLHHAEPRFVFMTFADKRFAPLELLQALEELGVVFEVEVH